LSPSPAAFDSLADVYGRGRYAPFTQALRLAGSAQVALVRFAQPAGEYPDPPTPDYTLALNEGGAGRMTFDIGAGRRRLAFRRGDLVLKGPDVATRFGNDAPHRKSFVSLPAGLVAQLAAETEAPGCSGGTVDFGVLHDGAFRSPMIVRLMEMMWAEPAVESAHGRLFNDGATLALVATLLRLAAHRPVPPREAAPLTAARLGRVREFVETRLSEGFGLAEMAASAGLSAWHFSRAFKAATGQTPRAFVVARRIERAKRLLAETRMPLAEVARECGFADQAHLTTAFGRGTGCTPGAFRRGMSQLA
jgi:AraC family transcriptional regulator